MENFLSLFMTIYNFMKNTTIYSFTIGEASISFTFLNLAIGAFVVTIGIEVLHKIMDW